MKVNIFKVKKNTDPSERSYIFIPSDGDMNRLFDQLHTKYGDFELDRTIDLYPDENRIALDSDEVLNNIKTNGFHVQKTQIKLQTSVG